MILIRHPRTLLAVALLSVAVVLAGCTHDDPLGIDHAIVRVESGLADTLRQRGVSVVLTVFRTDSSATAEGVLDPGTAGERRTTALNRCASYFYLSVPPCEADSTAWTVEFSGALANGPHHLDIHFARAGRELTYSSDFVIDVPSVRYTLTALPGVGGTDSDALDVNASGRVAGWVGDVAGAPRAATWENGTVTILPTSATARSSHAAALNDAGDVVGSVVDTAGTDVCERGIRWSGGTWRYVLVPARSTPYMQATTIYCQQSVLDINAVGTMLIGVASAPTYDQSQSWVDRSGVQTVMPNVHPTAINDRDEIVGIQEGIDHVPSFYSPGIAVRTPSVRLPDNFGHRFARLLDINDQSQILGTYAGTLFFAATPGQVAIDLNPVFTTNVTLVRAADNGTVLAFDDGLATPFLWRDGRTTQVAVTTPGWRLDHLSAINDAGAIVGHATEIATGRGSAVLLRPAP